MSAYLQKIIVLDLPQRTLLAGGAFIYAVLALLSMYLEMWWLPLAAVVFPALIYAGLRSLQAPFVVLVAIVAGAYLGNMVHLLEGGAIPFTLFQVFYLLGLVLFVIGRFISANFRLYVTGIEKELLLFFTVVFFHTIYTPVPETGLFLAARIFVLSFFVYLIINSIENFRQLAILFLVIIAISMLLAVLSVRDGLLNPEATALRLVVARVDQLASRGRVAHTDPNVFATFFFLPIAFVTCIIISKAKFWIKGLAAISLPILLLGIISTFSRSAWVSMFAMVFLIAIIYKQYKFFAYGFLGILLAVLIIPGLADAFVDVINRFVNLFSGGVDDSNRIRIILLSWAAKTFLGNYFMGAGFGAFPHEFSREYDSFQTIGVTDSHNEITSIIVEMGLIGLLVFAVLVFRILHVAWQNIGSSQNPLQKALATSVFTSMAAFTLFYQFIGGAMLDTNIWMLTGFVFAIQILLKKENHNPTSLQEKVSSG